MQKNEILRNLRTKDRINLMPRVPKSPKAMMPRNISPNIMHRESLPVTRVNQAKFNELLKRPLVDKAVKSMKRTDAPNTHSFVSLKCALSSSRNPNKNMPFIRSPSAMPDEEGFEPIRQEAVRVAHKLYPHFVTRSNHSTSDLSNNRATSPPVIAQESTPRDQQMRIADIQTPVQKISSLSELLHCLVGKKIITVDNQPMLLVFDLSEALKQVGKTTIKIELQQAEQDSDDDFYAQLKANLLQKTKIEELAKPTPNKQEDDSDDEFYNIIKQKSATSIRELSVNHIKPATQSKNEDEDSEDAFYAKIKQQQVAQIAQKAVKSPEQDDSDDDFFAMIQQKTAAQLSVPKMTAFSNQESQENKDKQIAKLKTQLTGKFSDGNSLVVKQAESDDNDKDDLFAQIKQSQAAKISPKNPAPMHGRRASTLSRKLSPKTQQHATFPNTDGESEEVFIPLKTPVSTPRRPRDARTAKNSVLKPENISLKITNFESAVNAPDFLKLKEEENSRTPGGTRIQTTTQKQSLKAQQNIAEYAKLLGLSINLEQDLSDTPQFNDVDSKKNFQDILKFLNITPQKLFGRAETLKREQKGPEDVGQWQIAMLTTKVLRMESQFAKMPTTYVEESGLDFCFFFACPLVSSFKKDNKTLYKNIPQLAYTQEFLKIKTRLAQYKLKLNVSKRQCTLQNLKEVLEKKPVGMHFSGHGIQNTEKNVGPSFHSMHKNDGDLLLLETNECDSQLVTRNDLKTLIDHTECKLRFVVVATCHSEFVGRIFLEAGAKHVICINQEKEVEDQAVLTFTDSFYDTVFQQKLGICKAFYLAQHCVRMQHSPQEAEIFLLLKSDHHNCAPPFYFSKEGTFEMDSNIDTDGLPSPPTPFFGRQHDSFKIIQNVLADLKRLITVIGLPGIGKSALVKTVLHYIQERSLLNGGIIFLNLRNVSQTEVLILHMLSFFRGKEHFDTFLKELDGEDIPPLKVFTKILMQLKIQNTQILIVFDNADDLITHDKQNFRECIHTILMLTPKLKILLTSRYKLSSLREYPENLVRINELSVQDSFKLFKSYSREFTPKEVSELRKLQADLEKYPDEAKKSIQNELHDHHLFRLLGGNPQSIILVAPMLIDSQMTLGDLYKMISSRKVIQALGEEGISNDMLESLNMSIEISLEKILKADNEAVALVYLLANLPSGIDAENLNKVWLLLRQALERDEGNNSGDSSDSDTNSNNGGEQMVHLKKGLNCNWGQPLKELMRMKLVRSEGATDKPSNSDPMSFLGIVSLPKYVRSFIKQIIGPVDQARLYSVLTNWISEIMQSCFYNYYNVNHREEHSYEAIQVQLNRIQDNVWAHITRMGEMYEDYSAIDESIAEETSPTQLLAERLFQNTPKTNPDDSTRKVTRRRNSNNLKMAESAQKKLATLFNTPESREVEHFEAKMRDFINLSLSKRKAIGSNDPFVIAQNNWHRFATFLKKKMDNQARNNFQLYEKQVVNEESDDDHDDKSDTSANDFEELQKRKRTHVGLGFKGVALLQKSCTMFRASLLRSSIKKTMRQDKYQLHIDEKMVIQYLTTLLMTKNSNLALSLIETHLERMNKSTEIFKGNVQRLKAMSLYQMVKTQQSYNETLGIMCQKLQLREASIEEAEESCQAALIHFQNNDLGKAQTLFTLGTIRRFANEEMKPPIISKDTIRRSSLIKEREQLSSPKEKLQAKPCFQEALLLFSQMKHLRGMALSSKNLYQLEKRAYLETDLSKDEIQNLQANYHEFMAQFNSQFDKDREVCISRVFGDEQSLLLELVFLQENKELFVVASKLTAKMMGRMLSMITSNTAVIEQEVLDEVRDNSISNGLAQLGKMGLERTRSQLKTVNKL